MPGYWVLLLFQYRLHSAAAADYFLRPPARSPGNISLLLPTSKRLVQRLHLAVRLTVRLPGPISLGRTPFLSVDHFGLLPALQLTAVGSSRAHCPGYGNSPLHVEWAGITFGSSSADLTDQQRPLGRCLPSLMAFWKERVMTSALVPFISGTSFCSFLANRDAALFFVDQVLSVFSTVSSDSPAKWNNGVKESYTACSNWTVNKSPDCTDCKTLPSSPISISSSSLSSSIASCRAFPCSSRISTIRFSPAYTTPPARPAPHGSVPGYPETRCRPLLR